MPNLLMKTCLYSQVARCLGSGKTQTPPLSFVLLTGHLHVVHESLMHHHDELYLGRFGNSVAVDFGNECCEFFLYLQEVL